MDIKPPCDVENLDDFVRYYENSYMETRDGRCLMVSGTVSNNLLLRDWTQADAVGEGYVLVPWAQVKDSLVFGRPTAGLFKINGVVYFMYLPQNRLNGRGFRGEYYRFDRIRDGVTRRWLDLGEYEYNLAKIVTFPQFTPLMAAIAEPGEHVVSKVYSVIHRAGQVDLFRRTEHIGTFRKNGVSLDLKEGMDFVVSSVRRNLCYTGTVNYASA